MSLLTPVRVPVKVYKSDDDDAPLLDKSPNCVATIFKACLVTGYGAKEGAGWTLPFEDMVAGIKVFRPAINPRTDFYLRLSADTGAAITPQVYTSMTDINTGDLRLQCSTPFTYGGSNGANKWLLIASPYGIWFFYNRKLGESPTPIDKLGVFLHVGLSVARDDAVGALILNHSGGSNVEATAGIARRNAHNGVYSTAPRSCLNDNPATNAALLTIFDGVNTYSINSHTSDYHYTTDGQLFAIAGAVQTSSPDKAVNMQVFSDTRMGECIAHGVSTFEPEICIVGTEFWEY